MFTRPIWCCARIGERYTDGIFISNVRSTRELIERAL
jgi:hypothetical protein